MATYDDWPPPQPDSPYTRHQQCWCCGKHTGDYILRRGWQCSTCSERIKRMTPAERAKLIRVWG